jgi:hypothetical protein
VAGAMDTEAAVDTQDETDKGAGAAQEETEGGGGDALNEFRVAGNGGQADEQAATGEGWGEEAEDVPDVPMFDFDNLGGDE